jgi:dienelactone hydrolase
MVWNIRSQDVAAVNVTDRYAKATPESASAKLGVRLFENKGGSRIVASVILTDGAAIHSAMTKAGTADLNDMPRFALKPGARGFMFLTMEGETRELAFGPLQHGDPTIDIVWTDLAKSSPAIARLVAWISKPAAERRTDDPALQVPMNKQDAAKALALLGAVRLSAIAAERKDEFEKKSLTLADKTLRWKERVFGKEPAGGHSLWISMHGGGGAPPAVNDQQWSNQVNLYEVPEGIYVAPRAPTDTWNLWHEAHIDPMFQRLIEDYVAFRGVNPDKVHLMGYSAGGDGVWQLAPRMADRFAAAAMMAGHPNEASLLGLRNLPFAIFMGGNDAAYDRNKIAANKTAELDQLAKEDPGGYVHMSRIYEGLGHWMNRKDGEAVPWMAKFQRDPWPKKVVWLQDDITHARFYWLTIPNKDAAKAGQKITATVSGQTIRIDGDAPAGTGLRLSDQLLDLDQAITVIANGKQVFSGKVPRTVAAVRQSLEERADPPAAAVAEIRLK